VGSPFHRHAELEANLISSGHATYVVGNRRVRLARRDVLWLFPGQDHVLIEQSNDFSMWILVWKPQFLVSICQTPDSQLLLLQDPEKILHRRLSESAATEIEALCEQNCLRDGDWHRASLAYILFGLWAAYSKGEEVVVGGAVHPAVERAARLLRDLNPPPAVPALARQVGLSPSRLSRLFAAQTGLSITRFRSAQCLSRALRLCEDSELPLSEIAVRAGFGSYAQFHRIFREQMGQSPTGVRAAKTR
jgi:AraC-like DNA-binding protein